jgi:hypothetical protein
MTGKQVWFISGAGRGMNAVVAVVELKAKDLREQVDTYRDLSTSLAPEVA